MMAVEYAEGLPQPSVLQPKDAAEAARLKRRYGADAVYAAGSTLLRTQWEQGAAPMPRVLIDLRGLPGLSGMTVTESGLAIGALSTLSECRRQPLLVRRAPALAEAMKAIAAPSVRNLGTIGGNVVSGVGDAWPALLAHDAELIWASESGTAAEPALDWIERFGSAGPETRVLTAIRLPDAGGGREGGRCFEAFRKVGRRETFTPSLATVALRGRVDASGRWTDCRIAAGGGSMKPMRLTEAEAVWNGSDASAPDYGKLYAAAAAQYPGAGDVFAGADYRKKTAAGLIVAALWERARERAKG